MCIRDVLGLFYNMSKIPFTFLLIELLVLAYVTSGSYVKASQGNGSSPEKPTAEKVKCSTPGCLALLALAHTKGCC
jgi:hypothetical protein